MKHYGHLTEQERNQIFYIQPTEFNKNTPKDELANALGATMYTPATKGDIAESLINRKYPALTTNVLCLEDSIGDEEVEEAEKNLFHQLDLLNQAVEEGNVNENDLPLLFVRVRTPEQLIKLLEQGEKFKLVTGFNLPKFSSQNGEAFLKAIMKANKKYNESWYAMPILETPEIIYIEYRMVELIKIKGIIDNFQEIILNIRLGGTDFSSLYGIRRGIDFTIYNIHVISNAMSDIVNLFGRASQNYTISGVVWEYFPDKNRMLKPQLRFTPFYKQKGVEGLKQREDIICKEIDGLVKEIILDKANNFVGKTVIHPSHITYVNGLQVVTYEEYMDAMAILNNQGKGVVKGEGGNKMNEIKPHHNWAMKVINKSKIYGVLNKDAEYVQLF
ncbi:citrate lyase subunit beta [Bacillus sp. M6-12]|uniref:HpcH/HpaI aldolase/citrate lyase family protein n=1 Tax=Bacillus sp. M6-12 TaxID=2054166 RepID=UPI000C77ACA6|nr:HpcH/HpaI aldolase/citrate lyase family protein [Bacillus sp. M6-12]PLS19731.1 citrate lyase subunit beta [Bacillus sp. M6-12]